MDEKRLMHYLSRFHLSGGDTISPLISLMSVIEEHRNNLEKNLEELSENQFNASDDDQVIPYFDDLIEYRELFNYLYYRVTSKEEKSRQQLPPSITTRRLESIGRIQINLTKREDDPSIALLDAWETVSDVLNYYQKRIAEELYLQTACERDSECGLQNRLLRSKNSVVLNISTTGQELKNTDLKRVILNMALLYHDTEKDRHFLLNPETGEIEFGDDKSGRIPAVDENKVIANYRTGGIGEIKAAIPLELEEKIMNILNSRMIQDYNFFKEEFIKLGITIVEQKKDE